MTILEAASWATLALKDRVAVLRNTATVAGRVMAVPDVDENTVMAAWLYKACEAADTQELRDDLFGTIKSLFPPQVFSIVKSMVAPLNARQEDLNQVFVSSLPTAKLIRVCECIMALDIQSAFLLGGSMLKLDEAHIVLNYSIHVLRNARGVDKYLVDELRRGIINTKSLWTAIHSAAEGIQNVVDPTIQVDVKLAVVANESGTVGIAQVHPNCGTEDMRKTYTELRDSIKGSAFTESLFHFTVPVPKQSIASNITPIDDSLDD